MKTKRKKMKFGYIIRLANDKEGTSLYYAGNDTHNGFYGNINFAFIYNYAAIASKLMEDIKSIPNTFMYISKIFYGINDGKHERKLTKPDRYDFINSI